ncbi:Gfo/Idh/MocA family protein [Pedobacter sp. SYSU D00535]|uniref:Gfo/Idh/MocA family protein n=1 Tax=Pedobacter sp. SYSU D00535 TaxID=2810308 RepID=UPI001A9587F0|nr:Gfo/Idh/MocA family oxidoreductase [Pedobacter sp. SYSU D00535]
MHRRKFLQQTGTVMAGALLSDSLFASTLSLKKKRVAMVGTGHRGTGMWGTDVIKEFNHMVEFVGLCDKNQGRVATAKKMMGVTCPTYTDLDKMLKEQKPEILIVTTMDSTHHEQIVKGLEAGADIITEKPMTTDEDKCQLILDAEKRTGKKVHVTFNYRYSPHRQKMYELINSGAIGKVTSVDFHWYLDTSHGADYFRRWHRKREFGGSLLVHKSTHHFDLLNWWLDSEPSEVFAYGSLEHYGKNGPFRHTNCRPCPHKDKCKYYWDITKNERLMKLYVENEKYDGYLRDGCVFKEDIDIFDKMAVQIKYANNVQVSYSLTTYSPYEGYRISFNGTEGKMDAWIYERQPWEVPKYDEIQLTKNFGKTEYIRIDNTEEGHGGGDVRLRKQLFDPGSDPWKQAAGARDGAMSILVGIAARQSIDSGKPVKIEGLTSLKPMAKKA